jgi:hypothetical protein
MARSVGAFPGCATADCPLVTWRLPLSLAASTVPSNTEISVPSSPTARKNSVPRMPATLFGVRTSRLAGLRLRRCAAP